MNATKQSQIDRMLDYAAECRKLADRSSRADIKATWLIEASRYQRMAERMAGL